MKEIIFDQKPLVFKEDNIVLEAYEEIDDISIIKALNAFLLTTQYTQLTFVFKSGKQGYVFGQLLPEFKEGGKYLFENDKGISKVVDIIFPHQFEFAVKNYGIIKESHRVLIMFYVDENDKDTGYWTFIKGDGYETP